MHKIKEAAKKFIEQDGFIVYKESDVADAVTGSERMLALGGGVKARIMRTKSGKAIVESFLFDKDRFTKDTAQTWIEKNMENITKSMTKVQENAPAGSFQDITMRVQTALCTASLFPPDHDGCCLAYICYTFADYVVVDYMGDQYRVDYTDENGQMKLGTPVKVTVEFVAQEAAAARERFEQLNKPNVSLSESFTLKIKEVTGEGDKCEIVAVLIEAGKNYTKNRYYPRTTIQEAAPLFATLKMFIDHPTDAEERAKPERSIKDWVSTIVESWYDSETGCAMGRVHIHDTFLKEKVKDPVFRENIGLSINASGKRYMKEIDGKQMEVIEKIFAPRSVDWVTEPGARGRVAYLLESQKQEQEKDMLKTLTLKELKEARTDLIEEAIQEAKAEAKAAQDTAIKEAVAAAIKPLQAELDSRKLVETQAKVAAQTSKIKEQVEASKLPAKAKAKLVEALKAGAYESDEKLTEAVKAAVTSELEYLAEAAGIKIGMKEGDATGKVNEVAKPLMDRLGLKEDKKDETK